MRLALLLATVVLASAGARVVLDSWITLHDGRSAVFDPDSLYQLRRVDRLRTEGWPPADRDPWMVWPDGAGVQWPPGWPALCGALLLPFAPQQDAAARAWLEHAMGWIPPVLGVLASLLATLAARRLAGDAAGLAAGLVHALCVPAIGYGAAGNADYHALVALAAGGLTAGLASALDRGALAGSARAARCGALLGLLAGGLWITWLGTIHHVLTLDAVLLVLLLRDRAGRLAGLPACGAALHLVALAVVLPVSAASPWLEDRPWSVEFLTWSQPLVLAAGAAFWLPLARLRPGGAGRRRWPWIFGGAAAAVAGALALAGSPLVAGVRAGLDSAAGGGAFDEIAESLPLLGGRGGFDAVLGTLGWAGVLLPIAWLAGLAVLRRERREALLPWLVAVPVLLALSLRQRRFANELALPMAVLTGFALARLVRLTPLARRAGSVTLLAAGAVALGLQWQVVTQVSAGLSRDPPLRFPARRLAAQRELYEWLARHAPGEPQGSVLATWGHGNGLLWAARQPNVATPFAYYVGADSRLAPSRCLLATDPAGARELLERFDVRFLLLTPPDPAAVHDLASLLDPALARRLVRDPGGPSAALAPAWRDTEQARLLLGLALLGPRAPDAPPPPQDVRLLHVSPTLLRGWPAGWILERVRGAAVEGRGSLRVELELRAPGLAAPLRFTAAAEPDADGVAHVRVPWATTSPNGDLQAAGPLRWTLGGRPGTADIGEDDVREGRRVVVGG